MSDDERQIRAGDHLWVQRLGYEHHGLASGRDTVIQYSGKDGLWDTGVIEEVPLYTFAKGRKVRFVDHPDRLHGRLESVRRARQRIGETEYNLVFNNCEHFVMWCIEDKHTSEQVNDAVRTTGNIAATAMMYRWYRTWAMEEAMGPTVRVATQMLSAGRTASTVTSAMNAASAARTAASLAPTERRPYLVCAGRNNRDRQRFDRCGPDRCRWWCRRCRRRDRLGAGDSARRRGGRQCRTRRHRRERHLGQHFRLTEQTGLVPGHPLTLPPHHPVSMALPLAFPYRPHW
ncbi:lecithin retinol acyltransferase family protein [Burkholderia sp. 1B3(2022)]|uniref:lecithin retinol acyltransferase family protein n=1 Tax=Burkholderia sp. 1B3(2022) TaxID=2997425 RepID=UPI002FC893A4